MSPIEIHARLGNTALFYVIILGLWGLWRFFRRQGLDSSYWGALLIAEILIVALGGLGAYIWFSGLRPERSVHILYGIISALVIPGVFGYTRGEQERRDVLIYGLSLLILGGLLLRAITTAGMSAG